MLMTALMMTAALAGDPDGVVATARAAPVPSVMQATILPEAPAVEGAAQAAVPHGLTTDQQIDHWLESRDPAAEPYSNTILPRDDRKMHGVVDVGIGTGGYRSYGAAVSMPLGENGRLNLSFRQVENGYPYGYGYGYGYGHGYGYGDPAMDFTGYAFPGNRPFAAAEHEVRVARPNGPPRLPPAQPNLVAED